MQYNFSKTKLLVVGDVMLDQYWSGRANRISPEAPVPVVKVDSEDIRAGGAANVALNVAALGASVSLLGIVGKDDFGQQLTQVLQDAGVEPSWVYSSAGTICKLRVLSHHQQLIRMDFENPVPEEDAKALAIKLEKMVKGYDALVVSDYAKGALMFVEQMILAAKKHDVPVLVDPKGDDFSRYKGATLIKPNQSEFELIVGACETIEKLVEKAKNLNAELDSNAILITRSEHGMALIEQGKSAYLLQSKAQEVFDVTGAGDTVMATIATACASGLSLPEAVQLANEAASIVVKKVGTSTVTLVELEEQIKNTQRHQGYVSMSELEVAGLVKIAQEKGEKVVFTNGCFDLLHSGHVRYLNEAANKGNRLIVAVNSDESVKLLKGSSRPVVSLDSRMELLSALSCVDWVLPFTEETPERLICQLNPDILVKGGDYKPEEIAGAGCVLKNGGKVEILSFWEGYSTSSMIDKIDSGSKGNKE